MLQTFDQVLYLLSARNVVEAEWDFPVIVFDGFHELLENFENQAAADKEKAKHLVSLLLEWVGRSCHMTHIVFVGENPFGEDILMQSKLYSFYRPIYLAN